MRQRTPALLDADGLWSYAVRALSGRAHSMGELREKLRRRAQRAGDVEPVLVRLKEAGYLNDRQFAESFATARLANQGLGSTRVLADLARRRVAPAMARQTVGKVYQEVDEQALAEDFVRRKFRLKDKEGLFQEPKELAAAYRRLRRAGFGSATAMKVLRKFARDPELLEGVEPPEEEETTQ